MPGALTLLDRFGKGVRDPIDGSAQLLTNMLPQRVVQGGNDFNNWIAAKTGMVGELPPGGVDEQVRGNEAAYQHRRADTSLDIPRLVGNILSPANLALASKVPTGVGSMAQMGYGALGGGLAGAMQPTAGPEFGTEKLEQIGVGSGMGGVIQPAVGALTSLFNPQRSAAMDAAASRLFAPAQTGP